MLATLYDFNGLILIIFGTFQQAEAIQESRLLRLVASISQSLIRLILGVPCTSYYSFSLLISLVGFELTNFPQWQKTEKSQGNECGQHSIVT